MKILRTKKKFTYEGIELRIVEREEPYMNSGATVKMIRVLSPNGGRMPIQISKGDTLKVIQEKTISALENFKSLGANVKKELTKKIKSK